MPRFCEPCRVHTDDDAATTCLLCGGATKFTLLPFLGEQAAPIDGLPTRETARPRRHGLTDFFRGRMLYLSLGVFGGIALLLGALWLSKGDGFEERVAKMKPGMKMTAAMKLMGDENVPPPRKVKISFGRPEDDDRMPDFDRPIDTTGGGHVEYGDWFAGVRIHFDAGVVTRVERAKVQGGMRRRITYNQ